MTLQEPKPKTKKLKYSLSNKAVRFFVCMNQDIKNTVLQSNTSLVGIVCRDGIVMGGDRRATAGNFIAQKDALKVKKINEYLLISWTGSVSDAQLSEKIIAAELRLKELRAKSRPTVEEAANLVAHLIYRGIRTPSMVPYIVGMLVAGVNEDGTAELYSIEPAGSVYKVKDYDANFSSGMPYILGLLERLYKKDVSVKEGIELARQALMASTQRDTGSGNGIDIFTITKDGIKQAVSEEIVAEYR